MRPLLIPLLLLLILRLFHFSLDVSSGPKGLTKHNLFLGLLDSSLYFIVGQNRVALVSTRKYR